MFLTELAPAFQKLIQQPVAFASGFISGALHLNLNEEPLSEWLAKQGYSPSGSSTKAANNGDRPQSINID
ncbi:MAG: hypothetical protein AAFR62_13510 [Cyanobacteria bacterium J06629_2]